MAGESAKSSAIGGLIKAAVTSIFGLVSGAFLMYATPLFNSAIKPAKPVANFAHQAQGLTVTFSNRSTGGSSGWWDFGDGSALEPFSPKQDAVVHAYPRFGNYTAKLTLTNLLNDESERTVAINLDTSTAPLPEITEFAAVPLSPGMTAPAVFRVFARVKNADLLVWSLGEGKAIEVSTDVNGMQERLVTIHEPGYTTFRLVAVGNKKTVEKPTEPIWVSPPETNESSPQATVKVVYEAVQVERQEKTVRPVVEWAQGNNGPSSPFVKEFSTPGFQVVKAELVGLDKDAPLKGIPTVEVAADKSKIILKGELIKPAGAARPPGTCVIPVKVTLEKRSRPMNKAMDDVPMYVKVPGSTTIPLPKLPFGWQMTKQQINLELKEGSKVMWNGAQMPTNAALQLTKRPVLVTATVQDNQLLLKVDPNPAGLRPLGN